MRSHWKRLLTNHKTMYCTRILFPFSCILVLITFTILPLFGSSQFSFYLPIHCYSISFSISHFSYHHFAGFSSFFFLKFISPSNELYFCYPLIWIKSKQCLCWDWNFNHSKKSPQSTNTIENCQQTYASSMSMKSYVRTNFFVNNKSFWHHKYTIKFTVFLLSY